jgi:hypothetical protein
VGRPGKCILFSIAGEYLNSTDNLTTLLHLRSLEATCATISLILPALSLRSRTWAYAPLH